MFQTGFQQFTEPCLGVLNLPAGHSGFLVAEWSARTPFVHMTGQITSQTAPRRQPPPSIVRIVPVVYPDAGLARNATALPISLGDAGRPNAMPFDSSRQRSA